MEVVHSPLASPVHSYPPSLGTRTPPTADPERWDGQSTSSSIEKDIREKFNPPSQPIFRHIFLKATRPNRELEDDKFIKYNPREEEVGDEFFEVVDRDGEITLDVSKVAPMGKITERIKRRIKKGSTGGSINLRDLEGSFRRKNTRLYAPERSSARGSSLSLSRLPSNFSSSSNHDVSTPRSRDSSPPSLKSSLLDIPHSHSQLHLHIPPTRPDPSIFPEFKSPHTRHRSPSDPPPTSSSSALLGFGLPTSPQIRPKNDVPRLTIEPILSVELQNTPHGAHFSNSPTTLRDGTESTRFASLRTPRTRLPDLLHEEETEDPIDGIELFIEEAMEDGAFGSRKKKRLSQFIGKDFAFPKRRHDTLDDSPMIRTPASYSHQLSKSSSIASRHKKGSMSADTTMRRSTFNDFKTALKKTAKKKDSLSILGKKRSGGTETILITDELVAALQKLPKLEEGKENKEQIIRHAVLVENQRGLFVFGQPSFSRNILAQWDPAGWSDPNKKDSLFNITSYELPGPQWEWMDDKFYVRMGHNVDESGWQYSVAFRWGKWKGRPDVWKSFVRRRFWIRRMRMLPDSKHYNPQFSDKQTPRSQTTYAPLVRRSEREYNGRFENGSPIFKLGLKEEAKREFLGWEGIIDVRSPFLPWAYVKAHSTHPDNNDGLGSVDNIWRENVALFNFQRFSRVIRSTKIDRQRLDLWMWWLGIMKEIPEQQEDNGIDGDMSLIALQKTMDPNVAWEEREDSPRPDLEDVMDLVERHLDPILSTFQFQRSAVHLIDMLQTIHEQEITNHRHDSNLSVPVELNPYHLHGTSEEMGADRKGKEKEIWFNKPRFQFWSEIEERKHELRRQTMLRTGSSSYVNKAL